MFKTQEKIRKKELWNIKTVRAGVGGWIMRAETDL